MTKEELENFFRKKREWYIKFKTGMEVIRNTVSSSKTLENKIVEAITAVTIIFCDELMDLWDTTKMLVELYELLGNDIQNIKRAVFSLSRKVDEINELPKELQEDLNELKETIKKYEGTLKLIDSIRDTFEQRMKEREKSWESYIK